MKNWKTTLLGALSLALAGLRIYSEPAAAADPQTMAAVAAAVGLLLAKDAEKAPEPPAEPAETDSPEE